MFSTSYLARNIRIGRNTKHRRKLSSFHLGVKRPKYKREKERSARVMKRHRERLRDTKKKRGGGIKGE
jgi:hypothetical protein